MYTVIGDVLGNAMLVVNVLVSWAGIFGISYKEINVWVFVMLWPVLTIVLISIIVVQRKMIRKLSKG